MSRQSFISWTLICSIATTLLARAVPALADDAPSNEAAVDERRTQAKSKYEQGAAAYAAGHYKDAVDLFLSADHLASSAPLSFNIARAYEKLGDDSSALRWYRDYLRRSPAASNAPAVRDLVVSLAHSLQNKGVQQVSVLSSPVGATVTIDDQAVGVTPWTGDLAPGQHHLLLTERGYADSVSDFSLVADQPLDLSFHLVPQSTAPAAPAAAATPQVVTPSGTSEAKTGPGTRLGVWPWVTLGASAAAFGGALTFELLRRSAQTEAKNEVTQLGYQDRLDAEQSRQTTARVFLGVGGGLLAAGSVMAIIDARARSHATSAGLVCLPDGCAIAARGRF